MSDSITLHITSHVSDKSDEDNEQVTGSVVQEMTSEQILEPVPLVKVPVAVMARTVAPMVINQDGKLLVSSRNVAAVFEKRHADVLRDVKAVMAANTDAVFTERNFALSEYIDSTGRKLPEYLLTKDGLMLLIMGYTGAKAMAIKVAYINRFNEMQAELEKKAAPKAETTSDNEGGSEVSLSVRELMGNAQFLLDIAGITGNQQVLALDKLHKNMTGKSLLALTNTQLTAPTQEQLLNPTQIGKEVGMSARAVNQKLCSLGLQIKTENGWEPTEAGLRLGAVLLDVNKKHNSGTPIRQLKWPSTIISLLV